MTLLQLNKHPDI